MAENEGRIVFSEAYKPAYLWKVTRPIDGKEVSFVIDTRGNVIQHGLPIWAWLLITGVASSTLSVLTVWAVWR